MGELAAEAGAQTPHQAAGRACPPQSPCWDQAAAQSPHLPPAGYLQACPHLPLYRLALKLHHRQRMPTRLPVQPYHRWTPSEAQGRELLSNDVGSGRVCHPQMPAAQVACFC